MRSGGAWWRRWRLSKAEWLLLAVSTTVSLGLLELALRVYAPLYSSPYEPDDRLLIRLVPGAEKAFTRLAVNGGQRIVFKVNRAGLRGEELRSAGELRRVIVFGDSNVQAEFSELGATFPKQLESHLRRTLGADVEVLNAGVVGYGPDQISRRLPADLERFKPALVIVVIFADNDFGDLIRNKIYRLDEHGALVLNHYRLAPQIRAQMQAAAHPRGLRRLQLARYAARVWWTVRQKALQVLLGPEPGQRYEYVTDSLARDERAFRTYVSARSRTVDSSSPFTSTYDADIALQPDSDSARYKVALMEQVLRQLAATTRLAATPLVLMILPSPLDACDDYDYLVNTARYPNYDRTRLTALVEGIAVRAGIPYLNLWSAFRAEDANRYYFHGGDDHWNDAGQARAAALMAEWITRHQTLAGARR